jgi:hypothetical protein
VHAPLAGGGGRGCAMCMHPWLGEGGVYSIYAPGVAGQYTYSIHCTIVQAHKDPVRLQPVSLHKEKAWVY